MFLDRNMYLAVIIHTANVSDNTHALYDRVSGARAGAGMSAGFS